MDWAYSNQEAFFTRTEPNRTQPHDGWAGRWDLGTDVPGGQKDKDNWNWIGFLPEKLKAILREGSFEPESTIRSWQDEKWVVETVSKDKANKE
jgi:hypothetical protein